ncbi:MAG: twin-arginine translocation signal domain-containing protein [Acidobacteriota bacterium]
MSESRWNRRRFLKVLGTAAAGAGVSSKAVGKQVTSVAIAVDPADAVAASRPAAWAVEQLAQALQARGVDAVRVAKPQDATEESLCLIAAGAESELARDMLREAGTAVPAAPESLGIANLRHGGDRSVLACGRDARGLTYALTELADAVENAPDPIEALAAVETTTEQPANQVRSITRLFTSNVQDKPWYNDRGFWPAYLDMVAAQRFNRFNLAFGIGYDFLRGVTDAYFLFAYPFLLKAPGYNVRVPQLPDDERDSNLAMLQYIGRQCAQRGLEFYVGLWMHGYQWIDSPHANYTIEGLGASTHGPYCRDAVRMLLQQVPEISGLTFRIHGESGVREGDFGFWKTVFDGVATCGRQVPIDMHAKGMTRQMIDVALGSGQPVNVSPKFWAEHMGMTYHQADIRKIEKPRAENATGLMALSSGTRSFLRYGYGDLLTEDRKYTIVHRVWSGTQRLLLWGDPRFAAAYSRAFSFCGSNGAEIQEPLSFKGRRGSGLPGSRCAYADTSLTPRCDFQKYEYTALIWGRPLYNPETRPEVWQRVLRRQFGAGAEPMQDALGNVSRILPVITTAYAPSAANNSYWPEIYTNQSLLDAEHYSPYGDALRPRVFGNASPLDPELFLSMNEYAEELLSGKSSGKYTPVDVAQWIEGFAASGRAALAQAEMSARRRSTPAYRRAKVDVEIEAGLGEFFGAKFRSGVLFHLYEITKERAPLEASIAQYRKARAAWAALADAGKGVYMPDITVGPESQLRGCWLDRLPAIDKDIAALSALLDTSTAVASPPVAAAIQAVLSVPHRISLTVHHAPPARFTRGAELPLTLAAPAEISQATLHYRHVNQAESYITVEMARQGAQFAATIPAAYTQTEFPMEYYFTAADGKGGTGLYPGLGPELTRQPYFVVRSV